MSPSWAVMPPTDDTARSAGWLYLLTGIPAAFALMYVPGTLYVPGDAAATAARILASEGLFRAGIVAGLASSVFLVLLALALYRLLGGVSRAHATLMVALVLVSVAIGFVNQINNLAALGILRGDDVLAVFDAPQREALAMLFLRVHSQGNFVNESLWGLWLLPFGLLVMRSGFIPRILGILLIVNCVAYVVVSATWLLVPACGGVVFRASMPALLGELWIMLWLLIKGGSGALPNPGSR